MRQTQILLIIFVLCGFTPIIAQEISTSSAKCNRLETVDKEFSVSLPPNYIVDAEERKNGQKLKLVVFQNDVEIEFQIIKDRNVKDRLKMVQPSVKNKNETFTVGDFKILKSETVTSAQKFQVTFWIIRKDTLYLLRADAKTVPQQEVSRLLYSIRLQEKPLFVETEKSNLPEETVSIASLKTSPEIVEAFARKLEKDKINVTYEANPIEADYLETEGLTRKAIILERPYPDLKPDFTPNAPQFQSFSAKLKVNFLANGQIGDITVLTIANKSFIKACLEAAQKIRFVPAQINDKNADSVQIVEYVILTYTAPINIRR